MLQAPSSGRFLRLNAMEPPPRRGPGAFPKTFREIS